MFSQVRVRSREIGRGLFFCSGCSTARPYVAREERTWLTLLFFIPVFPLSGLRRDACCESCRGRRPLATVAEFELTPAQAADVAANVLIQHLTMGMITADGVVDDREVHAALEMVRDLGVGGWSAEGVHESAQRANFDLQTMRLLLSSYGPMVRLDSAKGRWIVKELAIVAAADGEIGPEEMSLLRLVAEGLGVAPTELAEAVGAASRGEATVESQRGESVNAAAALGNAVIIVGTAMAAADGVILDVEINRVRQFFMEGGAETRITAEKLRMLSERIAEGLFDPAAELAAVAGAIEEGKKDMLLQFAMRVAVIDGKLNPAEREMLQLIAASLGLDEARVSAAVR